MTSEFTAAFPVSVRTDVESVTRLMSPPPWPCSEPFSVVVQGESLQIPYRIYHPPVPDDSTSRLSATQQVVLSCLYTRHHNGYVRHKHLATVLESEAPWVAPFVVRLLGEYVIEIVVSISHALISSSADSSLMARCRRFAAENGAFVWLTRQQAGSYWDCYHRHRYRHLRSYPGILALDAMTSANA